MRLGDLDKECSFQAPSGSPVVWTTIFSCKGSFWGLSGQEKITAMATGSTVIGRVRIKYRPIDIPATWRIIIKGKNRTFIVGVSSPSMLVDSDRYLEMQVKKVA